MKAQIYTTDALTIPPEDVCRYLGIRPGQAAPNLWTQIVDVAAEAETVGQWRALWLRLPVEEAADGLRLGPLRLPGMALKKHLRGAREAAVFCATAGPRMDQKIAACRLLPSRQTLWDAAGTAGIECFCDELSAALGFSLARFSPGYGDLPLSTQKDLLALLEADTRLGVGLTDALLMTPTKSVTAITRLEG